MPTHMPMPMHTHTHTHIYLSFILLSSLHSVIWVQPLASGMPAQCLVGLRSILGLFLLTIFTTPVHLLIKLLSATNTNNLVCLRYSSLGVTTSLNWGARCSSVVQHPLMCDGSSDRSLMVDPLSYFSFQPVLHNWGNKGHSICYPVCRWCI